MYDNGLMTTAQASQHVSALQKCCCVQGSARAYETVCSKAWRPLLRQPLSYLKPHFPNPELLCCAGRGVSRVAKTTGCALSGFALVKKVPGTLHFLAKSPGHSFDHQAMNMSHVVNYLYFGNRPSPKRRKVLLLPLCRWGNHRVGLGCLQEEVADS